MALPSPTGFAMALDASDELLFLGLRSGHVTCHATEDGSSHGLFGANSARREVTAVAVCGDLARGLTVVCACEHAPQAIRVMALPPKAPGDLAWRAKPELLCTHDALHAVIGLSLHLTAADAVLLAAGPDDELEAWRPKDPAHTQRNAKAEAHKGLDTRPSTQLPFDLSDPTIRALCTDPSLTTHEAGRVGTRIGDASLCVPDTY